MRLLCLGAGAVGTRAAEIAASFDEVESLTIADINEEAALRAVEGCRAKASARVVSAEDRASLVALMKEHDAVLNCIGPFFRFGVSVLTSAIEAGCHYFDTCDDPEPIRDMLNMGREAEGAGITAIVGLGASPGITNMLGARIHSLLTKTTELHAAWNIEEESATDGSDKLQYSAAIVHWMKECSGTILEQKAGKLQPVKPLQAVMLHYPGRGRRKVWTVGHPEPVSFAWSYPEIKGSSCYMVMPASVEDHFEGLSRQIDAGKLTIEDAAHQLVGWWQHQPLLDRVIAGIFHFFERPRLPMLFAIGRGQVEGKKTILAARLKSLPEGVDRATAIPLAIGLHQFAQGKIEKKGVLTPETALDGDAFFAELAPYCTSPERRSPEDLVEIAVEGA